MEPKKNRDSNLERNRISFFLLGLCFSSALVLTAFEWRTETNQTSFMVDYFPEKTLPDEIETVVHIPSKPKPQKFNRPVVDEFELVDELNKELSSLKEKNQEPFTDLDNLFKLDYGDEVVTEEKLPPLPSTIPTFPGGDAALSAFLKTNLKYPELAKKWGVQGVVWVTFLVDKKGNVTDIRVSNGIGMGCDEEAARVVSIMPRWNPGKQRGIPVEVMYKLPINFKML